MIPSKNGDFFSPVDESDDDADFEIQKIEAKPQEPAESWDVAGSAPGGNDVAVQETEVDEFII